MTSITLAFCLPETPGVRLLQRQRCREKIYDCRGAKHQLTPQIKPRMQRVKDAEMRDKWQKVRGKKKRRAFPNESDPLRIICGSPQRIVTERQKAKQYNPWDYQEIVIHIAYNGSVTKTKAWWHDNASYKNVLASSMWRLMVDDSEDASTVTYRHTALPMTKGTSVKAQVWHTEQQGHWNH